MIQISHSPSLHLLIKSISSSTPYLLQTGAKKAILTMNRFHFYVDIKSVIWAIQITYGFLMASELLALIKN